jgi:hypothetical protein
MIKHVRTLTETQPGLGGCCGSGKVFLEEERPMEVTKKQFMRMLSLYEVRFAG